MTKLTQHLTYLFQRIRLVIHMHTGCILLMVRIVPQSIDSGIQIPKLLKTLQIPNRIPLVVSSQHSLKTGIFVSINEVLIDIQSDPLDTGIGGGQAANTAPFPGKVISLRFREPFGST